ncbi:Arp2/3 complex-activating protein RickA [Candidatus Rickettsia kedanie]|uniref:Actin polymerization protein RickA n=1 Tax=Candidatus Rickettsia kedanie TaxID=3115352 RepID=A0ABP9TWY0_9RICK
MVKEIDINKLLAQENNTLNAILSQVNELCTQNKKLQGLIEIQNQTKALEKEHNRSLPWFKRLVKTVSKVKYIFVKSEEQLTNETIKYNNKVLKSIDNKIYNIAEKAVPLKQALQEEIEKNFKDLTKQDLSKEQRERLSEVYFSYKSKPERFSALHMTNPLQFIKAEELEKQYNALNATKQNIQNLISENSNITELKEIQKQVAEIREEIPYTFFEKLNNIWQNIKNVFVNNNEQVLAKNKESNTRTIRKIDEQLYKTKHKFEELIENKERNINDVIAKLPDNEELKKIVSNLANHMTSKKEPILTTLSIAKPLENNITPPPPLSQNHIPSPPPPPPMPTMAPAQTEALSKPVGVTTVKKPKNQPRPSIDTSDLMREIAGPKNLRKVAFDPNTGKPVAHPHSKPVNKPTEIASILARRIAVEVSDSSSSESESDSGHHSGISVNSNKPKALKTRGELDAKRTTHAQKIQSNRSSQKTPFVRS